MTLLRTDAEPSSDQPTYRLASLTPLSFTAGSESRVDSGLRRTAQALADRHPQLDWEEVVAYVVGPTAERIATPALLLADRTFPIAICLFGSAATLIIDIESDAVSLNRRFRVMHRYVESLGLFGYTRYGTDQNSQADVTALPAINAEAIRNSLRDAEALHHRRGWRLDGWVIFLTTWLLATLLLATRADRQAGLPAVFAVAALLALLVLGLQHLFDRYQFSLRLHAFQDELRARSADAESICFEAPRHWLAELAAIIFFGGLSSWAFLSSRWLEAAAFVTTTAAISANGLLSRIGQVRVNAEAVEGLGAGGRRRIAFRDIDRIPSTQDPAPCFVSSAKEGSIWISKQLSGYEHLLEVLWRRANGVNPESDPDPVQQQETLDKVREVLNRAGAGRPRTVSNRDIQRRPLWLLLMKHHPLRAQYAWQRHLLTHGRPVLAHIVRVNPVLLEPADHRRAVDAPGRVVFSPNPKWRDAAELSKTIERIISPEREEATSKPSPPTAAVQQFARELQRDGSMPRFVGVPAELSGRSDVYCTSLMIHHRQLPLGYLRRRWLPILIDPDKCRFAMVLPLRHWDASIREAT
jgi:hypothetical protein